MTLPAMGKSLLKVLLSRLNKDDFQTFISDSLRKGIKIHLRHGLNWEPAFTIEIYRIENEMRG